MKLNDYRDLFSLKDKRILVTGASGYLGSSISLTLASLGAHVIINGRSEQDLNKLAESISAINGACEIAKFDILDEKDVISYFKLTSIKPLHGLINNAYSGSSGSFVDSTDQDYRNALEISVIATQRLIKNALPSLRLAKKLSDDASIINISSMYGLVSPDLAIYPDLESANPPYYGASKAALMQLTKYISCQFASEGIRVNSVSPGAFPSTKVQKDDPELVRKIIKKIPLNRIGKPIEVAAPIAFLMTSGSRFITGENLVIDGGWTSL